MASITDGWERTQPDKEEYDVIKDIPAYRVLNGASLPVVWYKRPINRDSKTMEYLAVHRLPHWQSIIENEAFGRGLSEEHALSQLGNSLAVRFNELKGKSKLTDEQKTHLAYLDHFLIRDESLLRDISTK